MTYKENSKKFLEESDITVGDTVNVSKEDVSYKGILLDRSEDAEDNYIVLKLDSGYNVGIEITNAKIELIEHGDKPKIGYDETEIPYDNNKMDISIISTGGTVSSVIDYSTGAVHPAFTAGDLLKANPELIDIANYDVKALYNILSENMEPKYWVEAARSIADEINNGSEGVVIAHGTDTMHYTSAALSFLIESPVPIVVTGSQRSSDRPSTDTFLNLINSVGAAKSDIAEVTVCMHNNLDDDICALHSGVKVRKMHTSRRDTFRSINSEPIAYLKNGKIQKTTRDYIKRDERQLKLHDSIEEKVGLIKSYPGISSELIDYHIDKGYKGLLIEGTGLGHVPEYMIPSLERAFDEGIPCVMTSQCLYGRVNMNVYSTGRKLIDAHVISGEDMSPEVAYVKLCWALGQSDNINDVEKIMKTDIAGEITERTSAKYFLN